MNIEEMIENYERHIVTHRGIYRAKSILFVVSYLI